MQMMFRFLTAVLFLAIAAGDISAQRVTGQPGARRDRAMLEQRFRERYEQVVRERLSLTDAQFTQLTEVNKRLDGKRRELFAEERTVRREMRQALQATDDQANEARVAELMDRAIRVQRSRLDLLETEQRELSAFLTPTQRAKYMGMQEQLRRRADDMRRRAEGDTVGDAFGNPPPAAGPRRPMQRRPGGGGPPR